MGVAWLHWQGGVVNNVVDRGTSSGFSQVVYRREEGEENNKYNANIASQNITRQYVVLEET